MKTNLTTVFVSFKALLSISHVARSTPQFFGQSHSSSSFSGPNGKVVSQSVYTDSDGNRIINGVKAGSGSFPPLINTLVPPNLPGQINSHFELPRAEIFIPIVQRPPKPPTTRPPSKNNLSPSKLPTGSKNEGYYVHDDRGSYKPDDRGKYRGN